MNARLVYNPSAGTRNEHAEIEQAIAVLREHGWIVDIAETRNPGDATRLARVAAEQKLDALIAVGGDGTVNEVANGLVDSMTALGVLPSGTANVWAKEMGLPLGDMVTAAQRLAEAEVRAIDVGEVCGSTLQPRVFVLWSGVGLDAAITHNVEPQREMKRRLGALAFWLVGIHTAWSYRGKRATITVGGKRFRRHVTLALAANAQLYAGIVRIAPKARLDDGLLEFAIFRGTGFWLTGWHLLGVFLGVHVRDPMVEFYSVPTISLDGKNLPVHVDAEPCGFSPVDIRVRPLALRVLVPKTANKSLFVQP
ncbi:MAG TPA: diacylglycerol kinase family protein [Anaerolineae bacterium]